MPLGSNQNFHLLIFQHVCFSSLFSKNLHRLIMVLKLQSHMLVELNTYPQFLATTFLAKYLDAYAVDLSTFVGSLLENAPPPCGAAPPYINNYSSSG